MASPVDVDVNMVPAGEGSSSRAATELSASTKKPKRFEIKKWNAVSLWAWDIVVDNCAICRNHIMDLFLEQALSAKPIKRAQRVKNVLLHGVYAIMHFTSIVLADGSKHGKFARWITVNGSSKNMVISGASEVVVVIDNCLVSRAEFSSRAAKIPIAASQDHWGFLET